jgi:DNA-binding NtrC family response regulator
VRRVAIHRHRVVRILFVDDKKSDVELCLQELKRMDFEVSKDWVQTPKEFAKHLRTRTYDLIVCDYSMPDWTGMEALELLHLFNTDIPFIRKTTESPHRNFAGCRNLQEFCEGAGLKLNASTKNLKFKAPAI